ncbi:hypothetical protein HPB51_008199 [Rhipicephalus microplus]|uniref:Peptidase A2 domain-containing protein n=1 Tax=Rhipicephalus microplus TaxID=6941 RepID=A0A9J6EG61_RHIMP|nr:hypothetical protein HPB51_008199 [Rhipicephalus microplus]
MGEDMRAYVLQHETAEWLRPHSFAKLAQKFDESTRHGKPRNPAARRSKKGDTLNHHYTERLAQRNEKTGFRCFRCSACRESGHYQWQCSQTTQLAAEERPDRLSPDRLTAQVVCEEVKESLMPGHGGARISRLIWIELISSGRKFMACLDSGADITVIREKSVPQSARLQGVGQVRLRGAFGQAVAANVPLALYILGGGSVLELMELCVVTDGFAEEVEALLTPDTLEKLKRREENRRHWWFR